MYVTSATAETAPSLCHANQASVDLVRIRFRSVKYGVRTNGYTDLMSFRQIGWERPATDGPRYLVGRSARRRLLSQAAGSEGSGVSTPAQVAPRLTA